MNKRKGRRSREETSYEKQKFYVFYDEDDKVRYCGTAQQLIDEGYYSSISSFHSSVNHILHSKKKKRTVFILK
mgnify:FL=1